MCRKARMMVTGMIVKGWGERNRRANLTNYHLLNLWFCFIISIWTFRAVLCWCAIKRYKMGDFEATEPMFLAHWGESCVLHEHAILWEPESVFPGRSHSYLAQGKNPTSYSPWDELSFESSITVANNRDWGFEGYSPGLDWVLGMQGWAQRHKTHDTHSHTCTQNGKLRRFLKKTPSPGAQRSTLPSARRSWHKRAAERWKPVRTALAAVTGSGSLADGAAEFTAFKLGLAMTRASFQRSSATQISGPGPSAARILWSQVALAESPTLRVAGARFPQGPEGEGSPCETWKCACATLSQPRAYFRLSPESRPSTGSFFPLFFARFPPTGTSRRTVSASGVVLAGWSGCCRESECFREPRRLPGSVGPRPPDRLLPGCVWAGRQVSRPPERCSRECGGRGFVQCWMGSGSLEQGGLLPSSAACSSPSKNRSPGGENVLPPGAERRVCSALFGCHKLVCLFSF